jgi:quercetin dioxygenase-like cupin family protein
VRDEQRAGWLLLRVVRPCKRLSCDMRKAYSQPRVFSQMEGAMTVVRASARATKRGAADNFTGEVFQDEVLVGQPPSRMRATVVSFTPGARTGWHSHPVGQTLYCLSGVGRICIGKGSRPQAIYPGDTVMIPPTRCIGTAPPPTVCLPIWRCRKTASRARARAGPSTLATATTRWSPPRLEGGGSAERAYPERSPAISLGSSQPARTASASSPRLGGCGGIGRSGTLRLKRGAGAGCTTPSISI